MPITIDVTGFDPQDAARTEPVGASLYINGRLVGPTPFEDGLPAAEYRFEVEWNGHAVLNEVVTLTPGKPYTATRTVPLPPTVEQLAAAQAEREAELQAAIAAAAARQAAQARAMEQWERQTAPFRRKRTRMGRAAIVLGVSGAVASVAGLGTLLAAKGAHSDAGDLAERWATSVSATERATYANEVLEAEERRTRLVRAGAPVAGLGLSAIVAAVVVTVAAPQIPPEPRLDVSTLRLSPLASITDMGLELSGRF